MLGSKVISTILAICLLLICGSSTVQHTSTPMAPLCWKIVDETESYISTTFKQPAEQIRKIINAAYTFSPHASFPTPVDVLAVIAVESSFNPFADNGSGSGLMQVIASIHRLKAPYEIEANVRKGIEILAEYRERVPNDQAALMAYNHGPAKAKQLCPSLNCATDYTKKVAKMKAKLMTLKHKEISSCSTSSRGQSSS